MQRTRTTSPPESSRGLLVRMGARSRSVAESRGRRVRLAALLCGVTWLPLLVLSALEGVLLGPLAGGSFLQDPSPHARFLVALPLLVIAPLVIDPTLDATVRVLQGELLPGGDRPAFDGALEALARRRSSLLVEGLVVLLGLGLGVAAAVWHEADGAGARASWMIRPSGRPTAAAWYVFLVSSPVLMVMLWRWVWRLLVWIAFLWRIRRIPWKLRAAHPDHAGGMTVLAGPVVAFAFLFMVMGVLLSSRLAQGILFGGASLRSLVPDIVVFVGASLLLLVGPLCLFSPQLLRTKRDDMYAYARLGAVLAETFQKRWAPSSDVDHPELLDTGDPSALADYGTVFETVRTMRLVPIGMQGLLATLTLLLLPFVPLVFVQFPVTQVVEVLLKMLGLPVVGGPGS